MDFEQLHKVHIYNSDFDCRLLSQTASTYGLSIPDFNRFCVMKWNHRLKRYGNLFRFEKLIALAKRYDFPFEEGKAHRALYRGCTESYRTLTQLRFSEETLILRSAVYALKV